MLEDNDITLQLTNLDTTTTDKKLQTILAVTSASGELITDDYVYWLLPSMSLIGVTPAMKLVTS